MIGTPLSGRVIPRGIRAPSWWRQVRPLVREPATAICLGVILFLTLVAIAGPLLAPHDPYVIAPFDALEGPSRTHWLGTDENGRDVLSRLIYGTRISLPVGLVAVGLALVVGVPLGLVAGYVGGITDSFVMRLMDTVMAFPAIMLALAIIAILGPGLMQIMVAIGVTSVPVFSRIVRAQVLSLREREFVTAAGALGASTFRILFRHILPNTLAPLIVQGSLGMAFAILTEAGLSFLGVGVQAPTASWGGMLQRAMSRIHEAPQLSLYPGLAIFAAVLSFNIVGDTLRDILDPRLRGRLS